MTTHVPPEHRFGTFKNREAWEDAVIRNAAYFTVNAWDGPGLSSRQEFKTLREAVDASVGKSRVLIYAVTAAGRDVCLSKEQIRHYLTVLP